MERYGLSSNAPLGDRELSGIRISQAKSFFIIIGSMRLGTGLTCELVAKREN